MHLLSNNYLRFIVSYLGVFIQAIYKTLLVVCFSIFSFVALAQQPNIILILTDDQSYGLLGTTGNDIVQTPNIDKIAQQGVLFTNAHVSSAICTPSRVSILLGQYERKHGVNFNSGTSVGEQAWKNSYPVKIREAGYYTGWIGKNHSPIGDGGYQSGLMEKSFDYWYAGHGHMRFYPKKYHGIFSEAKADTQVEIVNEGINDFLTSNEHKFKKALRFLDKRPVNKPFMLSINFNLPHGASTSTMEQRESDDDLYKSMYRDVDIKLPAHYVAKADIKTPKLPPELLRVEDRQAGYNWVDTPTQYKERYIRQLQAMTGIDRLVGNLTKQLQRLGVDKNTVIIFTSDHGLFSGEFGLGGKSLCYEKTTHVPFIVYDPRHHTDNNMVTHKIKKNNAALVQSIDLAPTILSLAGAKIPSAMQGEDLSPLIHGRGHLKRQYAFSENLWSTHFGNPRCEAIQNNDWKYIRYYQNNNVSAMAKKQLAKQLNIEENKMLYGVHDNDIATYRHYIEASIAGEPAVYEELYNLTNDPDETVNLINDKQAIEPLSLMRKNWQILLKQARGNEIPKVTRYTLDSQLESNKNLHLE